MPVPANPKIFHICHVDRLRSIIVEGGLLCDAEIAERPPLGTTIGMTSIKQRRLCLPLYSRPGLHVGNCVPFYFCPRSIMLYVIHRANHESLNCVVAKAPSSTWKQTCGEQWIGLRSNSIAGRSRHPMPAALTLTTSVTWRVCTKSIGKPWLPVTGAITSTGNRLSF